MMLHNHDAMNILESLKSISEIPVHGRFDQFDWRLFAGSFPFRKSTADSQFPRCRARLLA